MSMNGTRHYDAAIIGAGQGGKPLAIAMAAAGTGRAAVGRVIDRYLAEGSKLCRLQTEKQTIHPRDLLPDKRRALIEGGVHHLWGDREEVACHRHGGRGD